MRQSIDLFKNNIKNLIYKFNEVINNIEIYYNINNNIINNYDKKERNYEILQNIKKIKNYNILNEINEINKDKNLENKIYNIINIYNRMFNKDISDINIISNNTPHKELSGKKGIYRVSDILSLRLSPERKYKPTITYKTNSDIICCDPCENYVNCCNPCCCYCCFPSYSCPSDYYKLKLNFDYDNIGPSDLYDSKYNTGNIGNSQPGKGSKNLPSYNYRNNRNDINNINDRNDRNYENDRSYENDRNYRNDRNTGNDKNDGNAYNYYEQKQFKEFLKKLMDVESNIEDVKADLANNLDFNVEDTFKLFDKNDKAY